MLSRFFKHLIKPKFSLNHSNLNEIASSVAEIKNLQSSGTVNDLTIALIKIDKLEMKNPTFAETARFFRGEVGYSLHLKMGGEDLNYFNHMRNYRP